MEQTGPDTRDAALVKAFVRKHFSWRGTARMHRAALGLDLLRAPLNVLLAPVFLLVRLAGLLLTRLRFGRAGNWLSRRRILLRSDVSRQLERALRDEILRPRAPKDRPACDRAARLIEDYVGIRSAIAEICTTLVVLGIGMAVFSSATPGILSLAPLVSDRAALATAVADFPLGPGLGRAWYGVFGHELSGWFIAAVALSLVVCASVVTTFAGLVADPVQAGLGIHRRRLMRLLARIDAAEDNGAEIAREHLLARLADLSDIAATLLRFLRP